MNKTEPKYVISGTDEEVALGDTIVTILDKNLKNGGKLKRDLEFKLSEFTLPIALELGIIEVKESKEENCSKNLKEDLNEMPLKDVVADHEQMIDYIMNIQAKIEQELGQMREAVLSIDNKVSAFLQIFNTGFGKSDGRENTEC